MVRGSVLREEIVRWVSIMAHSAAAEIIQLYMYILSLVGCGVVVGEKPRTEYMYGS